MSCQVIKATDNLCRNFARKNKTCCWSHRKLEQENVSVIVPAPLRLKKKKEEYPKNNEWPTPLMARKVIDRYDDVDVILYYINKNISIYNDTDFDYMKRMCILMVCEVVLKYQDLKHPMLTQLKPIVINKLNETQSPHLKYYTEKIK
jgi:hypothetical protein